MARKGDSAQSHSEPRMAQLIGVIGLSLGLWIAIWDAFASLFSAVIDRLTYSHGSLRRICRLAAASSPASRRRDRPRAIFVTVCSPLTDPLVGNMTSVSAGEPILWAAA
jgi:hypothetical protein